ncbi:hypothetical protein C8Q79DRAFT_947821 [Trametes meyenii]|nr:hypothetical protein C8Q79DRAFT_947821 [Trametes meyenii]
MKRESVRVPAWHILGLVLVSRAQLLVVDDLCLKRRIVEREFLAYQTRIFYTCLLPPKKQSRIPNTIPPPGSSEPGA